MKNLLKKVLGFSVLPRSLSYDEARTVLEKQNRAARKELAGREDAPPEMLYYLSGDEKEDVRAAVAANPSTPIQASERLADDPDGGVRSELARRIARLVPGADEAMQEDLRERVIVLFEKLAADKLPRVRAIIAEEIKASPNVPRHVVKQLARDAEISVCGPILEYSPLLSDADLMDLISGSAVDGAIEAVARREHIGEGVADAVARTLDIPAVTALLSNPNVQIREDTLDRLIGEAVGIEALHKPLVMRPNLSLRAIRRIASFVARSLLEDLAARSGLDEETKVYLRDRVLARVAEEKEDAERADNTMADIRKMYEAGRLDDPAVTKLADAGQAEGVILALSLLAGEQVKKVNIVAESRSAEAVTALCWKAGLSMRTAHAVQKAVHIPFDQILLPKGGFEYPIDEARLNWQLEFFGIEEKK